MNDTMTLTLTSPITEDGWDAIMDVDFDNTDKLYFHTKHGKEVYFIKHKTGHWIKISPAHIYECSECGVNVMTKDICAYKFCHNCGADMRGEDNG